MKEHKKYLSIFAALLLAVFAIVCVFGAACNKKDDDESEVQPPAEEHVHDYTVLDFDENGHWYECSADDGAKTEPESHTYGSYTVDTPATCTEDGSESAKCSVCGYTDTRVIEAVGHTYPDPDDEENVDWDWTGRTETAVTLTVTCTECGETLVHDDVEYSEVEGEDNEGLIGATYTVTVEGKDVYTYEDTYDKAGDETAEHHHHYGEPTWEWTAVEEGDETCYTVTATFTCESVVNKPTDEAGVVKEAAVTSEVTTPATCVQEGTLTYTATVVLDGIEYTDEKTETLSKTDHAYDPATEKWTWAVDGEGEVSAQLSLTCSVCGYVSTETTTESDIQYDETTGIYTATMTGPDGETYTDTYEIIEVATEYYFDFSDATTYGWLVEGLTPTDNNAGGVMYTLAASASYTTGIVTYTTHSGEKNTINSENAGALFTAGTSSNFAIDLSAFEGLYVSITIKMSSNADPVDERTLYVNNNKSTSSGIKSVTSSGKEDYQTLEYGEVISANETLYLTWSANIRIFTIEIKIMDPDDVTPEVRSVTLDKTSLSLYAEETDYLTATVEMTIGDFTGTYEWSSSDGTIARVEGSGNGATVIAVSVGTAIITVKAGGKEATCTVIVSGQSTGTGEYVEASFIVPIAGDIDHVSKDEFAAGSNIEDNSLFTLTAVVAMKYSAGKTSSSSSLGSEVEYGAIQEGSNAASFVDMHGNTVNPDQGIKMSTAIPKSENSVVSESGTIITVTAKEDITLYLYVQFTADGYSDNRAGKIMYSVDGGEKIVAVEGTSSSKVERKNIVTISIDLKKGQVLSVEAENIDSSSANFWLFGAEAVLTGTSSGNEEVGLPKVSVNFSDSSTYAWIDDYVKGDDGNDTAVISNEKTFYDGILSLVTSSSTGTGMQIDGSGSTYYLRTGGATQSSGRYFAIDLSSYVGKYVSISVVFCTQTNDNERSLMLSKGSSTNSIDSTDVIAYASNSSNSGAATRTTFSYILPITGETLYLTFSAEIRIYSIEIEILDEADPTVTGWTVGLTSDNTTLTYVDENTELTANLTLTISMEGEYDAVYAGGYSILSSDTAVVTVAEDEGGDIVVKAVGNGEATITVRLWDDPGKYATVTIAVTGFPADEEAN